jgi:Fe-S cluster assembly scaffold protein SufB
MTKIGLIPNREKESSSIIIRDDITVCMIQYVEGLEILPVSEALKRYSFIRESYWYKSVPVGVEDLAGFRTDQKEETGYFIRVRSGNHITLPCHAALYLATNNRTQRVHNIVVLEDNSELRLITGCSCNADVRSGSHLSVDEQYVGKNARLIQTMVHSWNHEIFVHPLSGTIVGEGGRYEQQYICLQPPKTLTNNPNTYLEGERASAKLLSVIFSTTGSSADLGGNVYLRAKETSAELVHRGVCAGGRLYQKGMVIGEAPSRAHVDCAGLLMETRTSNGVIKSIPGIEARHSEARMSHEASIGKINPEQVEYLQSKGMDEKEAVSLLVRGFLGSSIDSLEGEIETKIAEIIELSGHGESSI